MKSLHQIYHIKAPSNKVWSALTTSSEIDKWGAGPATMTAVVDTEFKLWGGDIFGKNLEVISGQKLVQQWSASHWPTPSTVTFILNSDEDSTTLELDQQGIPDEEFKAIEEGWRGDYIDPLKKYLESGV